MGTLREDPASYLISKIQQSVAFEAQSSFYHGFKWHERRLPAGNAATIYGGDRDSKIQSFLQKFRSSIYVLACAEIVSAGVTERNIQDRRYSTRAAEIAARLAACGRTSSKFGHTGPFLW